jgi:hypothetical protein
MQQMSRCPNCGSPIAAGQRFCGACGAMQSTACAYCGNPVDPGTRFCPNCGAAVGGGGQPQPGWGQQQPGWGQPQPGWGQPQPGWGQPQPGWGQPQPGQPQPGWGQPQPGWRQPPKPKQQSSSTFLVLLLIILVIGLGVFALWKIGPQFGIDIGKMLSGTSSSSSSTSVNTTKPVISSVSSPTATIADTSAVITWKTDVLSSSQVEYGTSASYGSLAPATPDKDPSYKDPTTGQYKYLGVVDHSESLTGLTANTTYHYRVRSKNKAGTEAVSVDNQITTTAATSSQSE